MSRRRRCGQHRGCAEAHRIWVASGVVDAAMRRARGMCPVVVAVALVAAACVDMDDEGIASSSEASDREPDMLTVMSWNAAHGRETSVDAVAFVIGLVGPDVVLLQETHPEEAEAIAAAVGMLALPGTRSKAALFSTPEITSYSTNELTGGRWPRSLDVYTYRGLAIANAHLDVWEGDRHMQARQVIQILEDENPAILGGDVNDTPDSVVFELFREAGWIDLGPRMPTYPTGEPKRRIDYIFGTRSWRRSAYIVDNPMSDHLPVIVELDVAVAQN